jgi:hypothetical protein
MEKEKNLGLPTSTKILIAVMTVLTVLVVYFFVLPRLGFGAEREMSMMSTGQDFNFDFDAGAMFHSNDSRSFYFATRDSMRFIRSDGGLVWHESFTFNRPWLATGGDFVAIGEYRGGRNIYVFDDSGPVFSVTLDNPIRSFWVNETGFLSVIVGYERGFGVYVFNQHRTQENYPFFHRSMPYDLIAPTHAQVSADGRYIAIAVLDVSFGPYTTVQFRYTSQRDAWGTDLGLFAVESFPGQLVTAMQFMNDNRLIIATNEAIRGFQLGPRHTVSEELWAIELENEKTHIEFYNGTHFAFAVGTRLPMATGEGYPLGMVRVFTANNGQLTGSFELGRRVTHLRMGHNAVMIGGDRSFHTIDFRGNHLWEHTTLFDTRDVLFLDNINTILVTSSMRAEVFERRRLREDDLQIEGVTP